MTGKFLLCCVVANLIAAECMNGAPAEKQIENRFYAKGLLNQKPVDADIKEPKASIHLHEALALALARNHDLKAFSWDLRASEIEKLLQAKLRPNPELEATVGEYDSEGTGFDTAETEIVLTQLIELGGKRRKRLHAAKLESELTDWNYETKRLEVFLSTSLSFIDVLAAQKSVDLSAEELNLASNVHQAVLAKLDSGKVSPLVESRARVEFSMSRIALQKAKADLTTARSRLSSHWGSTIPLFNMATGDFDSVPDSLPELSVFESSIEKHPDIARWTTEIKLREAELSMEKSERIPNISASAGVQQFEATGEDALTFGIAVPLPIFDRNQPGIAAAKANLSKVKEERLAAKVSSKTLMTTIYNELSSSHSEAVALKREILPEAQRAFEAASEGYEQGKFNYLDMLDAERTLFNIKEQEIEALSAYHKSAATLEQLTGISINNF